MLKLIVSNNSGFKIDKSSLFQIFDSFAGLIESELPKRYRNVDNLIVSLLLTKDSSIKTLNRIYRNINAPTDVLSFAYNEIYLPITSSHNFGDVVISVETAKRQAEACKHSLKAELSTLLVHGLLHLAGYDHNTDDEESVMNEKATRILSLKKVS